MTVDELVKLWVSDRKVDDPGLIPEFAIRCHLTLISHYDQAVYPLWGPSVTWGALSWSGLTVQSGWFIPMNEETMLQNLKNKLRF